MTKPHPFGLPFVFHFYHNGDEWYCAHCYNLCSTSIPMWWKAIVRQHEPWEPSAETVFRIGSKLWKKAKQFLTISSHASSKQQVSNAIERLMQRCHACIVYGSKKFLLIIFVEINDLMDMGDLVDDFVTFYVAGKKCNMDISDLVCAHCISLTMIL